MTNHGILASAITPGKNELPRGQEKQGPDGLEPVRPPVIRKAALLVAGSRQQREFQPVLERRTGYIDRIAPDFADELGAPQAHGDFRFDFLGLADGVLHD